MSVDLITWGRFYGPNGNKITVPAPNTNPGKPYLWDFLIANMRELAKHFDGLQLPPGGKALGGNGAGTDGYGVYDPRDLGIKNQQGSKETRYGSKQSYLQLIAMAHANGMSVSLDIVLHQLMGENGGPGVFRYLGADGKTLNGRGQTTPGWFRGGTGNNDPIPPFCYEDGVPNVFYDYSFGREKSYQNCNPHRVTIEDALDYGDWLFRTTGGDEARFDDVKGTWNMFVAEFMYSRAMANKPFYSEYFDNADTCVNWATNYPMSNRSAMEDFDTHFAIKSACNNGDVWALNNGGLSGRRPDLSVVFVENPDTDTSFDQQVVSSKLLGYAYALTIPCKKVLVYGKDYFGSDVWNGAYGLKPFIDNMAWINRTLAYGAMTTQYIDGKVIVLQRNGNGGSVGTSPGLLTAINFDTYNARTMTVPTTFWGGTQLHDFTGRHPDIWCDSQGHATFTIPSNAWGGGQSYLCFSWAGVEGHVIQVNSRHTTQMFQGSEDLDIGEATPEGVLAGNICCAGGSTISLKIEAGTVNVEVVDSAGRVVIERGNGLSGKVQTEGMHSVMVFAAASEPFKLDVTYMAPKAVK